MSVVRGPTNCECFLHCPHSSILHHVPTDAQLTLHLLRERERLANPIPRPPPPVTSTAAQRKLNDTSPLTDANEQATASSVGDGDEVHLVGDGELDPEEGGKAKGKVLGKLGEIGKKVAGKGATFRGKGKVEVLPEGNKKQKRTTKEKFSAFLLRRGELKDEGDMWSYPARLAGKTGYIIIDTDEGQPIEEATILFVPKGSDEPTREFLLKDVAELKKGGVGLPRSVLGWAAGQSTFSPTCLSIRLQ